MTAGGGEGTPVPRRPRRGLRRGCCRPPGLLPALGRETSLGTAWRRRRRHLPGVGWCVALAELVVVTRGRTLSLWVCWSRRHETRNTEQCSHAARHGRGPRGARAEAQSPRAHALHPSAAPCAVGSRGVCAVPSPYTQLPSASTPKPGWSARNSRAVGTPGLGVSHFLLGSGNKPPSPGR